jgi:hypothetical protein
MDVFSVPPGLPGIKDRRKASLDLGRKLPNKNSQGKEGY